MTAVFSVATFGQTNSPLVPADSTAAALPPLSGEYAPGTIPGGGAELEIEVFPPVVGQPFHAEVNTRLARTLPGGTQTTYEYHGIVARDSEGRVFAETLPSPDVPDERHPGSSASLPQSEHVTDPEARVTLRWDEMTKMVIEQALLLSQMRAQPLDACESASQDGNTGARCAEAKS